MGVSAVPRGLAVALAEQKAGISSGVDMLG